MVRYHPNWLARYNKAIYTTVVLISVLILIYRLLADKVVRHISHHSFP